MLEKILTAVFGSKLEKDIKEILPLLHQINEKEAWALNLSPSDFPEESKKLKDRIKKGESLDSLIPESFALVREAARRTLGERLYDVQLLGGIILHHGKIMEMKTGEGKTLSCVTAAYLNALEEKGVHIITVNDYLAERDANWMEPIYSYLGITVGAILSQMDNQARKEAYLKDITYGTNNEFGFDYLRDNMQVYAEGRVQVSHNYCIIDEIDSILIDEARTPLIISGAADDDTDKFHSVNKLINQLSECAKDPETGEYPEEPIGDYKIDEKGKRISFTDQGMNNIESLLLKNGLIKESLFNDDNFEYIHYFTQALKAYTLFHLDTEYVVDNGQVQIVDEFTGRILHGRRYSDGLHQAIEAKEHIKIAKRNRTLATITFQNFFRMYDKLSGMTGTAETEAREFGNIYNLDVVVIPTNCPLARIDEDDVIYLNEKLKYNAICDEIEKVHKKGQPLLVGTVSIEKSEIISKLLSSRGIRHEILNAKNHSREAMIIAEAGAKGSITIATNMAGRGTDIKLGGNTEYRARKRCGTEANHDEFQKAYEKELSIWRNEYKEVKELGGLYILGTERHESRRIDNQLRGRSGRQGDPGVSRFFISLDDDLMRLFAKDNLKNLMGKIGMDSGEPLFHPWINKAIEKAQIRVEDRNYEIRKHLLEYDDVLNEQRRFIYEQRDAILRDDNLQNRVTEAVNDILTESIESYVKTTDDQSTAFNKLLEKLKIDFFYIPPGKIDNLNTLDENKLQNTLYNDLEMNLEEKSESLGHDQLNAFIRYEYLQNIDSRWQDHLENLEALREAVYLRAYGQKNPLLEYKLEGFDIFDKLIEDIRFSIAKKIIKVKIQKYDESRATVNRPITAQESHIAIGQFAASQRAQSQQASPEKVQIKRTQAKVGRNDPCPCGSGKKYKYCCGK